MIVQTWLGVLQQSFQSLAAGVIAFIPNLVFAVVIFIIGWVIGSLVARLIEQAFKALRVDHALKAAGVDDVVARAGWTLNSGRFIGMLVQWFIIVIFLVASLEVLGLSQVTVFLQQVVLLYLPQVIVAALILVVAAVVANIADRVIRGGATAAGVTSANLAGTMARYAIWIFAILTALGQLGVATPFVQTLFTGIVVALSLAFGLAFGLGGQEAAARTIDRVRAEIKQ
jgi:hypothetical protein